MADRTLLDVIGVDFGFAVDPDSDGGQILNSLTLLAPLTPQNTGTAKAAALTMVPSQDGLRVQVAAASGAMVMTLPDGVTRDVAIVPPTGGDAALRAEITLVAPRLKLPLLRPAVLEADGMLTADAAGDVTAVFPKVRLVVTAQPANPDATVTLAPSRDAGVALAVQFDPVHALFGAGTVLGLGLPLASVDFDAPGGMVLRFPPDRGVHRAAGHSRPCHVWRRKRAGVGGGQWRRPFGRSACRGRRGCRRSRAATLYQKSGGTCQAGP